VPILKKRTCDFLAIDMDTDDDFMWDYNKHLKQDEASTTVVDHYQDPNLELLWSRGRRNNSTTATILVIKQLLR
jgi:hypothetical protein